MKIKTNNGIYEVNSAYELSHVLELENTLSVEAMREYLQENMSTYTSDISDDMVKDLAYVLIAMEMYAEFVKGMPIMTFRNNGQQFINMEVAQPERHITEVEKLHNSLRGA